MSNQNLVFTTRLLLAAVLLAGGTAGADVVHAPTLTAAGGTQNGGRVYTTVNTPSGKLCKSFHADYADKYPASVVHDGAAVAWRIADSRRPARVTTTMWRIGTDAAGVGPAESVAVTLSPVRSRGKTVAWLAKSAGLGYGDLHVDLTITWPKGRCGSDSGRYRYRILSVPGNPA